MSSRNDLRLDRGGPGDGAVEASQAIAEKLPAFYRENPSLVAPIADVAEDLVASLRGVFRAEEERIPRDAERPRSKPDAGTAAGLSRLLAEQLGSAPLVWNGFEIEAHPAGGLVFRRSSVPSAVIVWEKMQLSSAPVGFDLPDGLLPLGVSVCAVVLGRLPSGGAPQSGERISGEVIWRRSTREGNQSQ